MQDKLVITIVDESGSKQFRVPKNTKKIVIFLGIFLGILILSSIFLMKFLMQKIDEIAINKDIALSEYKYIYQKNNFLAEQIKQKSQELTIVSQKIGDLESIVDPKKGSSNKDFESFDLSELSSSQKNLILNLIPNGEPVATYSSKSPSSQRKHPVKNIKGINTGYDFEAPIGTPVYATADGVIDMVRKNTNSGYGNLVKVTHSFGFSSMYAHLEKSIVKKGDFVQKGQLIGYSGNSGNSNGNTLYYEVRFLGKILDPQVYTAWNAQNFDEIFRSDSPIDWKNLFWAIGDIIQLQSYKISYQSELPKAGRFE